MSSLDSATLDAVDDDLDKSNILVLAAEDWAEDYSRNPASHARLIQLETRLERDIRRFFRTMGDEASSFVDWGAYNYVLHSRPRVEADAQDPYSVDVIVQDTPIDKSDGTFLKVVFEDVLDLTTLGAHFGEKIYHRPILGIDRTDKIIQQTAKQHIANLIGKRIDEFGNIVDNPRSEYRISDTTRDNVRESIRTSLDLGEDQAQAVKRLRDTITNPRRAQKIAQTEAVNGFQGGLHQFAKMSGAIKKISQSIGAIDRCADYAKKGAVDIDYRYDGKWLHPSYHPFCRCNERYVYPGDKI